MGRPWRKLNYYVSGIGDWHDDKGIPGEPHWDSEHRYTFAKAVKLAKKLAATGFKEIVIERRTKRWTQEFEWNNRNKNVRYSWE